MGNVTRPRFWTGLVLPGLLLVPLLELQGAPVPRSRVRVLDKVGGEVQAVLFSPDGKVLATAGSDDKVHLRDPDKGNETAIISLSQGKGIEDLSYSPDGKYLAALCADGSANMIDTASRRMRWQTRWPNRKGANVRQTLCFSPDGTHLYFPFNLMALGVADARTGRLMRIMRPGRVQFCTAVACSADGTLVAAATSNGQTYLWNAGTFVNVMTLAGHKGMVRDLEFSPDSKLLGTCGQDGQVRVWEVRTGRQVHSFSGHEGAVHDLAFSPDGKVLASAGADHGIRLWDLATGKGRELKGHKDEVLCLGFRPDGKVLVSGSKDKTVRLWEISSY
jgi:WD40 repeat protein